MNGVVHMLCLPASLALELVAATLPSRTERAPSETPRASLGRGQARPTRPDPRPRGSARQRPSPQERGSPRCVHRPPHPSLTPRCRFPAEAAKAPPTELRRHQHTEAQWCYPPFSVSASSRGRQSASGASKMASAVGWPLPTGWTRTMTAPAGSCAFPARFHTKAPLSGPLAA